MNQIEELEAEVQRLREKKKRGLNREKLRVILNVAFLVVAAIGLYLYFTHEPGQRMPALYTIGVAMILKVIEFVLRFTA